MPLLTTVAGRYVGTLTDGTDIGMSDDNGYELSWVTHAELINRSDAYGQALLDFVFQGTDWRLRWRAIEWKAGPVRASYPWGGVTGGAGNQFTPSMGTAAVVAGIANEPTAGGGISVAGSLGSQAEGKLTLTATPGTTAAGNPTTLSAEHCILSPNVNLNTLLTSRARNIPLEYVLFPYISGTNIGWFVTA